MIKIFKAVATLVLGIGILILPVKASAQNATEPLPSSMASVGDSISAAAFAHLKRTDGWSPLLLPQIFAMIAKYGITRSITAVEERAYSWTTGLSRRATVQSHAYRLTYLNMRQGRDFKVFSGAVSRETSEHISAQLDRVMEWSRQNLGQETPDYMTVLIGPNDLCHESNDMMTSTEDFWERNEAVVSRLLAANPDVKIMYSTLPNVAWLKDAARKSKVGPILNCQKVWNTHHFCPNLLESSDEGQRAEVVQRMESYNEAIRRIGEKYNAMYGAGSVNIAEATYEYKFSDDDISVDCFHPNARGQNILSSITWDETWWGGAAWDPYEKDFAQYARAIYQKSLRDDAKAARRK